MYGGVAGASGRPLPLCRFVPSESLRKDFWAAGYSCGNNLLREALCRKRYEEDELVGEQNRRRCQHACGQFQIVQIFAAEIRRKARIQSFARNLDHS